MEKVVLGIDPGISCTGYGVVSIKNNVMSLLAAGAIRTKKEDMSIRLRNIFEGLVGVVKQYKPSQIAVEKVFVSKNVSSSLVLSQARSIGFLVAGLNNIKVFEYSPRGVKLSIIGYGGAEKEQIQKMVKTILNLERVFAQDVSDALAVAICHLKFEQYNDRIFSALNKGEQGES